MCLMFYKQEPTSFVCYLRRHTHISLFALWAVRWWPPTILCAVFTLVFVCELGVETPLTGPVGYSGG